jgi:flagellar hook assembly protein FlgD
MGQQVATVYSGSLNAGRHNVTFNGRDMNGNMLSSGMYIYRVTAGKYNATKKMTLMK